MAAELLFDIQDIDIANILYGQEELNAYLPQEGAMRQIDHMAWVSDDLSQCLAVKHVRDDEFWVSCHIPGRPIMPGVLMIEAAAKNSSVLYRLKTPIVNFLGFTRCDNAIFRGQIVPGDTLLLLTQEINFSRRRFITNNQAVLNGKLIFEVQITGMRM